MSRRFVVFQLLAVGLLFTGVLQAGVIVNGGFESPGGETDYPGWTISGNTNHFHIYTDTPHSGLQYAGIGPVGSNGILTQTVDTAPGAYTLSFWLANPDGVGSGVVFQVFWNGSPIADLSSSTNTGWLQFTYNVTAVASNTLEFDIRHDPGHWRLDDVDLVSASGVPEPGTWVLLAGGLGALGFWKRRR